MKTKNQMLLALSLGLLAVAGASSNANALPAGTVINYQYNGGALTEAGTVMTGSQGEKAYYNYKNPRSLNPLQKSNTAVFYFYNDSMGIIFDKINGAAGGHVKADITGLDNATYLIKNDPAANSDIDVINKSVINVKWTKENNDGALIDLNTASNPGAGVTLFDITFDFSLLNGINKFAIVTGSQSNPIYTYIDVDCGCSNILRLTASTANATVPEPGSMLLLGSGLVGAVARRRKKLAATE